MSFSIGQNLLVRCCDYSQKRGFVKYTIPKVTIGISLSVEATNTEAGQQQIAGFCEPWIRQTTGQQIPRTEKGFDVNAMKELAIAALRKVVTEPFLTEQGNQLEAQKRAALEAVREQATAGMELEITIS
jgi:hypothetical protein